MRIIKYLSILVISVVILPSCQSSSSLESTKSDEFRIVSTTV
ncbi:heme ABC transporter substrate-binding protein IsdE, partial [Staphylococcus aureus]|nr:heme ABC transporter substrate-binding protein IsdE [Staphylococcus aureus]